MTGAAHPAFGGGMAEVGLHHTDLEAGEATDVRHTGGLNKTGALDLRGGPVLVGVPPSDVETIKNLVMGATLLARHRRVHAVRILNGWLIAAFDE